MVENRHAVGFVQDVQGDGNRAHKQSLGAKVDPPPTWHPVIRRILIAHPGVDEQGPRALVSHTGGRHLVDVSVGGTVGRGLVDLVVEALVLGVDDQARAVGLSDQVVGRAEVRAVARGRVDRDGVLRPFLGLDRPAAASGKRDLEARARRRFEESLCVPGEPASPMLLAPCTVVETSCERGGELDGTGVVLVLTARRWKKRAGSGLERAGSQRAAWQPETEAVRGRRAGWVAGSGK